MNSAKYLLAVASYISFYELELHLLNSSGYLPTYPFWPMLAVATFLGSIVCALALLGRTNSLMRWILGIGSSLLLSVALGGPNWQATLSRPDRMHILISFIVQWTLPSIPAMAVLEISRSKNARDPN